MNRKTILTGGVACALLIGLLAIPASAHGGRHHSGAGAAGYAVCTVEGCTESGRHTHDGVTYCGYHHADGYCTGSYCGAGHGSGRGCHAGRC